MSHSSGIIHSAKLNTSLISSGIGSLDSIFGGGLAVGSIIMIEEDSDRLYSSIIAKCFLAEGILSEQRSCLLIADEQPDAFMKNLPAEATSNKPEPRANTGDSEKLDIAWRYAKTNQTSVTAVSSSSTFFGHKLDLSKSLHLGSYMQSSSYSTIDHNRFLSFHSCNDALEAALTCITSAVRSSASDVLRVVIPSFASPAWGVPDSRSLITGRPELSRFMSRVRALARQAQMIVLLTVQNQLYADTHGLRERLCAVSDYCFQLESFAASDKEKNPVFKDYRGAFRILKLPLLNAACPSHRPETLDLAFKVRSQNFIIEPLCLPPDLSESASRTMSRDSGSVGCGSHSGTSTEF